MVLLYREPQRVRYNLDLFVHILHRHCHRRHYIITKSSIKPHEVFNKGFGRQRLGPRAFPTEQTTLSVRSKSNIKNTRSPITPKFMGVVRPAKEALFGLCSRSLSHKICLIRSPTLRGERSHGGLVLFIR